MSEGLWGNLDHHREEQMADMRARRLRPLSSYPLYEELGPHVAAMRLNLLAQLAVREAARMVDSRLYSEHFVDDLVRGIHEGLSAQEASE